MGRAEDMGVRHLQAIDQNLGMAAGHGAVERVDDALDLDRRMRQVHEEHRGARGCALTGARHDDADLGADRSGDEHLAAMDVPISAGTPCWTAVVISIDGSEPAPPSAAGSVMKKAERCWPDTRGTRKRSFCCGVPILDNRNMLPSSGAMVLTATGPSGERPERSSTAAVSRWLRWCPSGRM